MPKPYFDIAIVVPLEEELAAFTDVFKLGRDISTNTDYRFEFSLPASSLKGVVIQQDEAGKSSAIRALRLILDEFDVGLVICVGIAGAMSNDLSLGDVCYSGDVLDVSENSKASDKSDGNIDWEFSPNHFSSGREITAALNFVRTRPDLQPFYAEWQQQQESAAHRSLGIPVLGRGSKEEELQKPKSRNGTIVCGPVSRSPNLNKKLLGIDRKILAIETEAGGIFEEAGARGTPALVIRGISDYADEGKNTLEVATGGRVRRIAAANAVTFLSLQLRNKYLLKILEGRRQQPGFGLGPAPSATASPQDISSAVVALGSEIDAKLRELSPEFKLQPKGYRLPVPRIEKLELDAALAEPEQVDPAEVRNCLEAKNVILIVIPRTYPDSSLPWIIADDLLTSEIGDKQLIPIVLSGNDIKPPKSTIDALSANASVVDVKQLADVQPVYIIEDVPFLSKSRISFIVEQVRSASDAKFIFITRGDPNLIKESEFISRLAADVFSIRQISFTEIAIFIQKNFGMSDPEAEVIALRLRDTFNRFALSAHPTYFAGIPRETLSALLQANRRSELIQLAVDGFLTFVVASDRSDIALNRTTRSRFLRKLALALNVEKKSFNQEALVAFTKEFADQYDFDIDLLEFIHSFLDKGILRFESELVRFSLPFIESYLLAAELKENPNTALQYFQIDNPDFDFPTFDLYAEMGASSGLVKKTFDALDAKSEALKAGRNSSHILLTDEVRPQLLAKPDRIRALQQRIRKTIDDVQKNRSDKGRKQRMLDIADRIRQRAAKQSSQLTPEDQEKNDRIDQLSSVLQVWTIGTLLLGAGSENLEASVKQRLAKQLVEIASMAIDEWTKIHITVDFNKIKSEITARESIEKIFGKDAADSQFDECIKTVTGMVDILEYSFLGEPFRRTMNQLCEQARLRVLAPSVQKATVVGSVEGIIHSTWLADIDGKRGKEALKAAMKALPAAPFLRIVLATHYLTRVYWSQWNEEDRLMLLDAAAQILEPVQLSVNKSQRSRDVKRKMSQDN